MSEDRSPLDHRPLVCVIGAGPAGCAAASALSAAGLRVIVFEQGASGRDKPCGDAFLTPAVRMIEAIGAGAVLALTPKAEIGCIGLGIGKFATTRFRTKPRHGYVMRRSYFDGNLQTWVRRLPGVEIRFESTVLDIVKEGSGGESGGMTVSFRDGSDGNRQAIHCDGVIVATGAHAKLSRKFDLDGAPDIGSAISLYVPETVRGLDFRFESSEGYFWRFEVSGSRSNVGACGTSMPKGRLLDRMARHVDPALLTPERCRGGVVPLWNRRFAARHDDSGIVSCGDAAGLADPETGEGLSMALISGHRAGAAMAAHLNEASPTHALSSYSQDIDAILRSFYRRTVGWRIVWKLHEFVARMLFA